MSKKDELIELLRKRQGPITAGSFFPVAEEIEKLFEGEKHLLEVATKLLGYTGKQLERLAGKALCIKK